MMLIHSPITPIIAVSDLHRSKDFYETTLELKLNAQASTDEGLLFEAGNGTNLYLMLFKADPAPHPVASFAVHDIEKTIELYTQKGIIFEDYDELYGEKTETKRVRIKDNIKYAWFKDPDGNIFTVLELPQ